MNFVSVESVADAVLFEGYMLYPYRPSALKNRQRWNFGTLYPRTFALAQSPPERCQFRADSLIEGSDTTHVTARVRFLQLASEEDGTHWKRGFSRSRTLPPFSLQTLLHGMEYTLDLSDLASEEREKAAPGFVPKPRCGKLILRAEPSGERLYKLTATFANESPVRAGESSRIDVEGVAFVSAHLLLGVEDGTFVSLLEPPPEYLEHVRSCVQDGVFPVLAGAPGERGLLLCSPIILYDYPQVAPESTGDFFDGTEMDEMLALRVLTLTDEERREMQLSDPHARSLLERMEVLPQEHLARVHGAIRGLRAVTGEQLAEEAVDLIVQPCDPFAAQQPVSSVRVFGVDLRRGDRVRLWPQKKADIFDMEMEGKVAFIEAIEQDLDDNVQFAVVLEDDPGRDLGLLRQPGHRFFFSPEEVEPVGLEAV